MCRARCGKETADPEGRDVRAESLQDRVIACNCAVLTALHSVIVIVIASGSVPRWEAPRSRERVPPALTHVTPKRTTQTDNTNAADGTQTTHPRCVLRRQLEELLRHSVGVFAQLPQIASGGCVKDLNHALRARASKTGDGILWYLQEPEAWKRGRRLAKLGLVKPWWGPVGVPLVRNEVHGGFETRLATLGHVQRRSLVVILRVYKVWNQQKPRLALNGTSAS
eukprot:2839271-Rhodomonas_salina.1